MSQKAEIKIVLNPSEEPHYVYVNNVLEMRNDRLNQDGLDPFRGFDWVELIQKYGDFSKIIAEADLSYEAYEKYRTDIESVPLNIVDFKDGELSEFRKWSV